MNKRSTCAGFSSLLDSKVALHLAQLDCLQRHLEILEVDHHKIRVFFQKNMVTGALDPRSMSLGISFNYNLMPHSSR